MRSILFLGLTLCFGAQVFGQSEAAAPLRGDCNQDGVVNALDIQPFVKIIQSGTFQEEADCNSDGMANLLDIDYFIAILSGKPESQKGCLRGDVNQDGEVNLSDVDPFIKRLTSGEYQCEADINGDGTVSLFDTEPFVDALIKSLAGSS